MRVLVCLLLPLFFLACRTTPPAAANGETLTTEQLAPGLYRHVSYLATEAYGRVACNGAVFVSNGEALVLDAPVTDSAAALLLDWIATDLEASVVGVVATHFHVDCTGGLAEFHRRGVPSHGHTATLALARTAGNPVPEREFGEALQLSVGGATAITTFFGAGHTRDNVVTYLPSARALFGGCLIKGAGAGRGNLADADVTAWSATVERIMAAHPDLEIVIPGHGRAGGPELLEYTATMFRPPGG